jgi:deoxyribodipyrimidine photo-lyase
MSVPSPVIVWFRDDLRVHDNPALSAAAASGRPVLCVYLFDAASPELRPLGGAARWWLHGSLDGLAAALASRGARLHLLRGPAAALIETLARETGAEAVFWNRRYEAAARAVDAEAKSRLKSHGIRAESFNGHLLYEPWTVLKDDGTPFRVFTPYWRAARSREAPSAPLPAPARLDASAMPRSIVTVTLDDLGLEPKTPDWAATMRQTWRRDEVGAEAQLEAFLADGFPAYAGERDRPDRESTSRLSPYLRFGNISVRRIWHAAAARGDGARNLDKFQAELGWREFSYHLLFHRPDLAARNFQAKFDAMPWRHDPSALRAWQKGRTGYPIVDAGMRQLWATGWMHNRVRMIVASFLTKHLLLDWRSGEAWFWDTLVDADPASNAASWQWVAGSGADAAPYFRVFNPILQARKFDPDGTYVRRWVPELAALDVDSIHTPTAAQRAAADNYPPPIVQHEQGRARALDAFRSLSGAP